LKTFDAKPVICPLKKIILHIHIMRIGIAQHKFSTALIQPAVEISQSQLLAVVKEIYRVGCEMRSSAERAVGRVEVRQSFMIHQIGYLFEIPILDRDLVQ
jgi:hypothetical protein